MGRCPGDQGMPRGDLLVVEVGSDRLVGAQWKAAATGRAPREPFTCAVPTQKAKGMRKGKRLLAWSRHGAPVTRMAGRIPSYHYSHDTLLTQGTGAPSKDSTEEWPPA